MRSVTLTHFVNRSPEGEQAPLTMRQVYDGLKLKSRDARPFVSMIEKCEVLSESETGLLRVVNFKGRPDPIQERVEFFPPTTAEFTMLSPTGETAGRINNVISTTPDGELLLTFTFALGPNGPEDLSQAAEEKAHEFMKMADETIGRTIKVIRDLVKEGKV